MQYFIIKIVIACFLYLFNVVFLAVFIYMQFLYNFRAIFQGVETVQVRTSDLIQLLRNHNHYNMLYLSISDVWMVDIYDNMFFAIMHYCMYNSYFTATNVH